MIQPETHASENNTLRETISAEADLISQFVDLLRHEQSSLAQGVADDLPALAEQKNELAIQLNKLAVQRTSLLAVLGFTTDRSGVATWCANHKEQDARGIWDRILALATEARELNRVNGELIQIRMQFNTKALEALNGARNSLELYGPDGQSTKSGNRRINDAV